jgi:MerR family transcriptional regulator, copper efflux regulator
MGGTCAVREEPGKQKPRSCRAQELARSSAQEMWAEKGGHTEVSEIASAESGGRQEAGTVWEKDGRTDAHVGVEKERLTLDYTPGCSVWRGANVMQIGIVAKRIGLSVDAIRFYERNGLLPRPPRTGGGFRRYCENDVETLAFVRRVQGLGFKLSEIRGLLRLRGNRLQPCAPVQRRLQEKLVDVQRKLSDLHKLEHELRLALRSCNKELRNREAHCPILREKNPGKPESAK